LNYELVCILLTLVRWLERVCLIAALCVTSLLIFDKTEFTMLTFWLWLGFVTTALFCDIMRSFLVHKADIAFHDINKHHNHE
jgi:hypothetical protein